MRPTESCRSSLSARGTRAFPCGGCSRTTSASALSGIDLDAIFDYDHYVRHAQEIIGRLDQIA